MIDAILFGSENETIRRKSKSVYEGEVHLASGIWEEHGANIPGGSKVVPT